MAAAVKRAQQARQQPLAHSPAAQAKADVGETAATAATVNRPPATTAEGETAATAAPAGQAQAAATEVRQVPAAMAATEGKARRAGQERKPSATHTIEDPDASYQIVIGPGGNGGDSGKRGLGGGGDDTGNNGGDGIDGQDGNQGSVTVEVYTNNVLTATREFLSNQTYSPPQSFSVTTVEWLPVTTKDYDLDAGNDDPAGLFADDAKVYVWDDTDNHLVEYPSVTNRTLPRTGLTLIEWESLVVADDKLFVLATDSATRKWVAWDFPARTRSATDDVNAGAGLSEADGATFRDNRLWQLLDDTLYAYSLSDAQSIERFPNGDFQLHVDNADVHGMTIDGDDLFTVDDTGLNILGYNSSGNRNSLLDRALDNDNSDPGAIASDDTYFYVTDAEDDQVYRYVRVQTTITNPGHTPDGGVG